MLKNKAKKVKYIFLQRLKIIYRFFLRNGRKTGRWCIRFKNKCVRLCAKIKKSQSKKKKAFSQEIKKKKRIVKKRVMKTINMIKNKAKKVKRKFLQRLRIIYRFFLRNGRKAGRWCIRSKNKCVRLWNKIKKSKGGYIKSYLQIAIRNCLYRFFSDQNFFFSIKEQLDQIPESNGTRYYKRYQTNIGIIADEFLFDSYKGIANFIYITPENYRELIDNLDFLLVVSAWRGLNNEWRQMGTIGSPANLKIHEVISYYKEQGKKVVFYSKEDPPNYEHFLPIAQECDVIFTSAYEKVDCYKKDCKTEQVYTMKFGINPLYHNPIGTRMFPKRKEVIFSGSWVKKYPERIKTLKIIFDGVLKSGRRLKIIDRNYNLNAIGFFFPHKYDRYISPSITHDYLQKTHKLFDWAININSVTDSKTMFANRVYELQAAANLMLSNQSIGVEEQFQEVIIVKQIDDVKRVFESYTEQDVYEHQMAGVRRVMTGETTFDRVGDLLNKIGIEACQPDRKILVLMKERTPELERQFADQSYVNKRLIDYTEVTLEDWLDCDMVTVWDSGCEYGKYYLEDMSNAFKYTACDYVCKNSFYIDDELKSGIEHNYVSNIKNIFAVLFWRECISMDELHEFVKCRSVNLEHGYSIDRFQFNAHSQEVVNGTR